MAKARRAIDFLWRRDRVAYRRAYDATCALRVHVMQASQFGHGTETAMPDHRGVTDDEILSGFKNLLDAVELGFASLKARMNRMEARMDTLAASLEALEQRTLRRFDRVDERFDRMDARFDRMDARFDGTRSRFRRSRCGVRRNPWSIELD